MSDPIVDILRSKLLFSEYADNIAKQIRQQIGRELLGERHPDDDWRINRSWLINRIREVCQLEEE